MSPTSMLLALALGVCMSCVIGAVSTVEVDGVEYKVKSRDESLRDERERASAYDASVVEHVQHTHDFNYEVLREKLANRDLPGAKAYISDWKRVLEDPEVEDSRTTVLIQVIISSLADSDVLELASFILQEIHLDFEPDRQDEPVDCLSAARYAGRRNITQQLSALFDLHHSSSPEPDECRCNRQGVISPPQRVAFGRFQVPAKRRLSHPYDSPETD
ncbi:Uncharacterized protein PBTT_07540 [Plasmodiophora brassicae]